MMNVGADQKPPNAVGQLDVPGAPNMIDKSELDPELLSLVLSSGRDPWAVQEIEIEAARLYCYTQWTLDEFQEWISSSIDAIPEHDRTTATVLFDVCYDGGGASLTITYNRRETEDEVADRVGSHVRHAIKALERERETFDRLKQKYG
jgi:hypothetical protein